jgi:4-hydroxy-3-methylbut-2-en-1-yl diphosphate reductase
MVVEIDEKSGFCFGVQNAVEIAEEALARGEKVYSLGHIVHNDIEVDRLYKMGLLHVDHDEFRNLRDCKILIRAHGEPPEIYYLAEKNNITIIEATCPIVKKLQGRIKSAWQSTLEKGGQVVIFGKAGHAEVIGLMGQTDNKAILTDGEVNLDKIDYSKDVHLFAQTTMSNSDYKQLIEKITIKMAENGIADPARHLHINNTICGQVSNRQPGLKTFAKNHDVIVFVSGKESSNGKILFSVVKNENPLSWFISSPEELKEEWFAGKKSAGVCGATSTPKWLIDQVRDAILNFGF